MVEALHKQKASEGIVFLLCLPCGLYHYLEKERVTHTNFPCLTYEKFGIGRRSVASSTSTRDSKERNRRQGAKPTF